MSYLSALSRWGPSSRGLRRIAPNPRKVESRAVHTRQTTSSKIVAAEVLPQVRPLRGLHPLPPDVLLYRLGLGRQLGARVRTAAKDGAQAAPQTPSHALKA